MGFCLSWWAKDEPALREAYNEIKRSKVGRIALLTGLTGKVEGLAVIQEMTGLSPGVAEALDGLRLEGTDIRGRRLTP